jgi:hypothetical protein
MLLQPENILVYTVKIKLIITLAEHMMSSMIR